MHTYECQVTENWWAVCSDLLDFIDLISVSSHFSIVMHVSTFVWHLVCVRETYD